MILNLRNLSVIATSATAAISRLKAEPQFLLPKRKLFYSTTPSRHLPPQASQDPTKPLSTSEVKSLVLSHCRHGKFYNLLQNVVASPSVLLTACQNLSSSPVTSLTFESVSAHFFSLQELSSQIVTNKLDLGSCCVSIPPANQKGEVLVLPNLKLKVVIEAIRMVLEIVYDDRFVSLSYGGRVNMGRHTAIRYLKNNVVNPTWWFTVTFCHSQKFNAEIVDKLCMIIWDKIIDEAFIDMIKRLFDCGVVSVELGSLYFGRGFPQECSLSSILANIYFHRFDKEVQELRIKMNKENPKFDRDELVAASRDSVFYRPLKIYAVRYLDEILVTTSGTKRLTLNLKSEIVHLLEEDMGLKVDKEKSVIHSPTSEKIEFLGMELQAVAPSILHPTPSEKAIRARKKYLRQKEVRLLELRNAKERNRKKLGMKLLSNAFKKLKHGNGFKFDFHIENEVRQIFGNWADEVVQEYLMSAVDERWEWHRKLSFGDFLSLKKIREQLPQELVLAYDNFQEQIDKHLKPVKAMKALEEAQHESEMQHEQNYAKKTIQDLTTLKIKVQAPEDLIQKAVKLIGFTNDMGRPRPLSFLMALEDAAIIKWYAGIGIRWLEYFCCCHNFKMVKTIVTYHLRFSCILTLAEKHESSKREAIRHYTKDLKVKNLADDEAEETTYFPTERQVKMMRDQNLADPKPVDGLLTTALIRLASDEPPYTCIAHFCNSRDTVVYRIWLLQNHLKDDNKWISSVGSVHENLNKKCIPLCCDHISQLYMGSLTLQDVDCTSFIDSS